MPAHSAERGMFRYPLQPRPRIVVVCDTLRVPSGCRQIPEGQEIDLRSLRADTIAAPVSWLLRCDANGWIPTFPLVAFTGTRHGFLEARQRNDIWRRFGVPVFEQLAGNDGRVFAYECEAHDGLHVDPLIRHTFHLSELLLDGQPTGMTARKMTGLCGCGKPGTRITDASLIINIESSFAVDPDETFIAAHA